MSIHNKGIELLQEYGVPKNFLWLCEVQTVEECARHYGHEFVVDDLCGNAPQKETHIIYYHEDGCINTAATFDPDNAESFQNACKYVANYFQ